MNAVAAAAKISRLVIVARFLVSVIISAVPLRFGCSRIS
jgi:hypothetical protein